MKAFVGLCVPRVEFWLLDGFDLSPWKTNKMEKRRVVPTVNVDDSEVKGRSRHSFKKRVKDFFKGFKEYKYHLLGAEGYRRYYHGPSEMKLIIIFKRGFKVIHLKRASRFPHL